MLIGCLMFVAIHKNDIAEIGMLSIWILMLIALFMVALFGSFRSRYWIKKGKCSGSLFINTKRGKGIAHLNFARKSIFYLFIIAFAIHYFYILSFLYNYSPLHVGHSLYLGLLSLLVIILSIILSVFTVNKMRKIYNAKLS